MAFSYVGLTAVFLFLTVGSIWLGHLSLTYDEPQHFRYGAMILDGNSDRFDDSKMPISAMNAAASRILERLAGPWIRNEWQAMSTGRTATVAFSAGVGLLCAWWARRLGGRWAGLAAYGLYVFEPNILAHSSLITTDIYSAGTITLALFLFWRFLEAPTPLRAASVGVALGLAQISKYTGLLLYPLFVLLAFVHFRRGLARRIRSREAGELRRGLGRWAGYTLLIGGMSLIVINAGFLFNRTGIPFGEVTLRSPQLRALQASSSLLRRLPVPVPYPYLDGLDQVLYNERTGENYGRVYLLGSLREGRGFPGYFLVASLVKIPLGIWALFVLSLMAWLRHLREGRSGWPMGYLLVPVLVFAVYFNFLFRAQIGIRFFVVAFPAILIFVAQLAAEWRTARRGARVALCALGVYVAASVVSFFPDFIPYVNEFVPDRKLTFRILADSNVDWGQSDAAVEEQLQSHPEYIFEPEEPSSGLIVVGVNRLTGVLGDPEEYQWLRDHFTPVGHIRYTHLIFEVSRQELEAAVSAEREAQAP